MQIVTQQGYDPENLQVSTKKKKKLNNKPVTQLSV